jgi:RND family efflux transporter MFP subunit
MSLAAFRADHSLIVVGHLLQKSGKSCSTMFAANLYLFFRCAHGYKYIVAETNLSGRNFLVNEILQLTIAGSVPQPYAGRQNTDKIKVKYLLLPRVFLPRAATRQVPAFCGRSRSQVLYTSTGGMRMAARTGSTIPDLSALRIDEGARKPRSGPKWPRWVAAAIGLLLLVFAALYALRGKTALVEVATAQAPSAGGEVALLNASGYVTPRRRATVAAKITARVTQMYADEGMHVREGQVLALLDDSDYRVRLNSAKADRDATAAQLQDLQVQLANAEIELHRTQQLTKQGVSSPEALDNARTTADSLRAKIAMTKGQVQASDAKIRVAQQDLDNCTVRAPFAGIVVSKDAQVGEMVSPNSAGGGFTRTGIATIVDMKSLEVEVDVNESYIARVRPGMPVTSVLDAYPNWQIPSKVRTIIPTADRQKATVKVRIAFDQLDPRILPDMGVKVTFLGNEGRAGKSEGVKVLVPQTALRNESGSQVVYLYKEGHAERRAVGVGETRGSDTEITAGLAPGDQVVVSGFDGLHDGERVEIRR